MGQPHGSTGRWRSFNLLVFRVDSISHILAYPQIIAETFASKRINAQEKDFEIVGAYLVSISMDSNHSLITLAAPSAIL
jgi:hypothetical protein